MPHKRSASSLNAMLSLPEEMLENLDRAARRSGLSLSELVEQVLRRFLDKEHAPNAIFLSAPVNALVEGLYEENTSLGQLRRHGDFGLGTFNDLDGEMAVLEGRIYQMKSDGVAYRIEDDSIQTPFACVTFFRPDTVEEVNGPLDFQGFNALFQELLPSANILYAIRIDGRFDAVRTRSVPRQENYRPLVEVARTQPTFDYRDVEGTLIGFFTPKFMESLNVPGLHLHFLSSDRTFGGHLLECRPSRMRIALQHVPKLVLGLPLTLDYLTAELGRDTRKDLEEAER